MEGVKWNDRAVVDVRAGCSAMERSAISVGRESNICVWGEQSIAAGTWLQRHCNGDGSW